MSNNIIFQDVREGNEQVRITNEIIRNNNEMMRCQNETRRDTKFSIIENNIIQIDNNENIRKSNEDVRIGNEKIREKTYNDLLKATKDIDLSNTISAEVIGARGKYDNLKNRFSEVDDDITEIRKQISDILYKPIEITSFTNDKNIVEIGSILTRVVLNWDLNKALKHQTIDGEVVDNILREYAIVKPICKNIKFTLEVTDERNSKDKKETYIEFLNGIYYGVSNIEIDTSGAILNLNKILSDKKNRNVNVNCGNGQYIYYCLPSRLGECRFMVGGFEGGFNKINTINFTNSQGYSESYDIYKSTNSNLGNTNITIL